MEIWKDIVGYEGLYQISNHGNVKRNGKIIKSFPNTKGYLRTILSKNNKKQTFFNHRLVAKHFLPNPANKSQVNHIDGDKLCNYEWNLEWVTNSENQIHGRDLGLIVNPKGEEVHDSKLTESDVLWIRENYKKGDKEYGSKPLARKFDVSQTTIRYIIQRKKWKHI